MASSGALELTIQAKALADMADEWAAMESDNITVNDLRERAGRFRKKSREISVKDSLNWNDYLKLILSNYTNKPDDYTITVGDMSGGDESLPEYRSLMQMTLGDLRSFATGE